MSAGTYIYVDVSRLKNDGALGEKCNRCGGYGYTNTISGSAGCFRCDQTGIEPVDTRALQAEVRALRELLDRKP